jgi:hypothetical protein
METIKIGHTQRGFARGVFTDSNSKECSIQKSSAIGDFIWLGCNDIGMRGFVPYGNPAWRDISDDDIRSKFGVQDIVANNRMHLSRIDVQRLLPILEKFAKTGEID